MVAAYIIKGPKARRIMNLSQEDFDKGVAEGWVSPEFPPKQKAEAPGPHKAAEAYLNRELKAEGPTKRAKPEPAPAVVDETAATDDEAAPKSKGGRPKKA